MKKLIILLSLFIISCGDTLIEEIIERYDDGQFKVVAYYKKYNNNQKLVRTRVYHQNGQIEKEENYKDGKLDGKRTFYSKNGQIEKEENYKDGKLDGKNFEWIYSEFRKDKDFENFSSALYFCVNCDNPPFIDLFSMELFTLSSPFKKEEKYKNGELKKRTLYDKDGQVRLEENYSTCNNTICYEEQRKKSGKWTLYYENGQIRLEGNYVDLVLPVSDSLNVLESFKIGKWTSYYKNGQICGTENYKYKDKKEVQNAVSALKDAKGNMITNYYETSREIETLDGKRIFYSKNRQILIEENYKDGVLDGKWINEDEWEEFNTM